MLLRIARYMMKPLTARPEHPLQAPAHLDTRKPKPPSRWEIAGAVGLALGMVLTGAGTALMAVGLGPWVLFGGLGILGLFALPAIIGLPWGGGLGFWR